MQCLLNAWQQHHSFIYNWLLKQTNNRFDSEDLLQDVFLKAYARSSLFCDLDNSKAWLFKVTKNHYLDSLRRQHTAPFKTADLSDNKDIKRDESISTISKMQPCILKVLPKLNYSEREILELCYLNNMPQQQYANLHKITLSATKSRLMRAKKKLKLQLINECNVQQDSTGVCCFKGS